MHRANATIAKLAIIAVPRIRWLHGEALCPSCGLPIGKRDLDEELREPGTARAVGAVVTHRRCGARFQIAFDAPR